MSHNKNKTELKKFINELPAYIVFLHVMFISVIILLIFITISLTKDKSFMEGYKHLYIYEFIIFLLVYILIWIRTKRILDLKKTLLECLLNFDDEEFLLKQIDVIISSKMVLNYHVNLYMKSLLLDIKNNVIPNTNTISLFANILDLGLEVLN